MAKDPAFLFYTNDFDSKTKFFTHEQVGKFMRLLMAQHQHGHLTIQQMIFICGSKDETVFAKFEKDADGNFFNERLELEIGKRKTFIDSRKNNRSKPNSKKKKSHMKKTSVSHDSHMGEHMEIDNEIDNDKDKGNEKGSLISIRNIVYPFTSEDFFNKWNEWLAHRKEIKKPYKTEKSEQAALKELSEYDEIFAIRLIDKSMAKGWVGLVFDSTPADYKSYLELNGFKKPDEGLIAKLQRKVREQKEQQVS